MRAGIDGSASRRDRAERRARSLAWLHGTGREAATPRGSDVRPKPLPCRPFLREIPMQRRYGRPVRPKPEGIPMSRPASLHTRLLTALLAAAVFVAAPAALAFDAPAGKKLSAPLYKTTEALVQSLLADEDRSSKVDKDGDLEVTFRAGDVELPGWVVFDRLDDGTIWNLRLTAPIPTELTGAMDTNALIAFANRWNRDEIAVKLYLDEDGQLRAEHDLPARYGLNPNEFKENGIRLYEQTLSHLLDGLAAGEGDDSDGSDGSGSSPDNDGGSSGAGPGSDQPIKSAMPPDDSRSL